MNIGSSASSPSAARSRFTAAFRLCSKSTNVPAGPQPLADAVAGDHVSRLLEQEMQDLERLVLQPRASVRRAQLAGIEVEFKGAESDDWRHGDAPWGPSLPPRPDCRS
jgi:hypothetical protein